MALTEHFFDNREALFESLTALCELTLEQACNDTGRATFMASGGSTPAPLYQALSQASLPWSQIDVALVDERWVEPQNPSSNQTFIEESLLQNKAAQAPYTVMKNAAATAKDGLAQTSANYGQLSSPWDVTILGMGGDGHTASIFPNCDGIEQVLDANSDELVQTIIANRSEVTGDNLERITLSLAGLLKSRQLILLITGDAKRTVYQQALENTDHRKMPVSAILQQQQVPVHVFWAP